jgi:DNA processing protein
MNSTDILTLLSIPGAGRVTVLRIINSLGGQSILGFNHLIDILNFEKSRNSKIQIPTEDEFYNISLNTSKILQQHIANNIQILNITQGGFPERLKSIPNPPLLLYCIGDLHALHTDRSVAIIGTREPTEYGVRAGLKLGSIFAKSGFTVVSGLAIGCDTVGHIGSLNGEGRTIAVLPGGLDKIYPKQNTELATKIVKNGGCLISEYPMGTRPRRNHFIERDRLQSGLSQGVLVLETDIRGGTMHTVKFSEVQGKILGCLWGHPNKFFNHAKINGNKMLIESGRAYKISNPDEIMEFMNSMIDSENHINSTEGFGQSKMDFEW